MFIRDYDGRLLNTNFVVQFDVFGYKVKVKKTTNGEFYYTTGGQLEAKKLLQDIGNALARGDIFFDITDKYYSLSCIISGSFKVTSIKYEETCFDDIEYRIVSAECVHCKHSIEFGDLDEISDIEEKLKHECTQEEKEQ